MFQIALNKSRNFKLKLFVSMQEIILKLRNCFSTNRLVKNISNQSRVTLYGKSRGDVPGWVLVVLMTTALVTGIWSIAAPKLTMILRNSLDAMAGIK
mgnify:CR=1 FL=1